VDARRHDVVRFVEIHLLCPASICLRNRRLHRVGHLISVHDHSPIDVPSRSTDSLYQCGVGAQKTFLVCVQDRYQLNFGQIETFTQQIDANDDIENSQAQVPQDPDTLKGLDLRVQVVDFDPKFHQVI
jgi:hypothetical protein